MEKKTRTKIVEVSEEYFVASDGTEFEVAEQCMEYEKSMQRKQRYPRINMAFYDDNLEYVREAAYQSRMSVTEYVNQLIKEDKQRKLYPSGVGTIND